MTAPVGGRLPEGTRLLHIGPHKTGTTTVQAAFHDSRPRLGAQGVHYAGPTAHPMVAAMAAANGKALATEDPGVGARRWAALLDEVRASRARATVLSSEFFSEAPPERIRTILDELGPDRTHVVVTLRPVVRILASQWQQYMQNRPAARYDDALGYEGWLDAVLNHAEEERVTPSFWNRHRHDKLVRRWAGVVGPERMTVVVVDESDPRMVLRSFEEMLALDPGTLESHRPTTNRSLTVPEVEVLRAFNRHWLGEGWSVADYTWFVRFGAVRHLQQRTPEPDEPRLLTPAWAVERAAELGAGMAEQIAATGVRVVGDLALLGDPEAAPAVGENPTDPPVPVEVAARFAAGLVSRAAELPARPAPADRTAGSIEAAVRDVRAARAARQDLTGIEARIAELRRELEGAPYVDEVGGGRLLREVASRVRRRAEREVATRVRRQ